jgi:hypothetical protein
MTFRNCLCGSWRDGVREVRPSRSRLCPETSTKLYVHEFGFRSGQIFEDHMNDLSSILNIYFMVRSSVSDTDSLIPGPDPAF